MNFRDRALLFLATGFRLGSIPYASGTFGALLGIPLAIGLAEFGTIGSMVGAVLFLPIAIWIADRAEILLKQKDPAPIVIDEIAGMAITLAGLPLTGLNLVAGFVFFRILDITKPFPARTIERNMAGGWGIVLDDATAGLYSNLLLRALAVVIAG
jgi:phosphatidylglycerophosphatase A